MDLNGTPRSVVGPLEPAEYVGVDLEGGRGVDKICDARRLVDEFGRESFDVVISTEMIEHLEDWQSAVQQMKDVLKVGGRLLLTTRSIGFPYHPHPVDCWRFSKDDFSAILKDMEIEEICDDPGQPPQPGVFGCGIKKAGGHPVDLREIVVYRMPVP
jgi:SAM-dependent methyltransferase